MDKMRFFVPSNVCDCSDHRDDTDGISHVILDLEMCKVNEMMRQKCGLKMEIIQIGAALLNERYEIVSEFDRLVKPEYGRVDSFIHSLTGIINFEVSKAENLERVVCEFEEWIPANSMIVSWSMTDRKQLLGEMQAKGISSKNLESKYVSWIDSQSMFAEKMNIQRRYSLEEALIAADIFTEGKAHNGLVDARNTAFLYAKMSTDKEFRLNPYYKQVHEERGVSHLAVRLGKYFLK